MTLLQALVPIILQSFCQSRKKNGSLVICVFALFDDTKTTMSISYGTGYANTIAIS